MNESQIKQERRRVQAEVILRELSRRGVDRETAKEFLDYHRTHPSIWKEFKELAFNLWSKGTRRYGAKAVFEVIRYHREIGRKERFKLCNSYTAYYARLFEIAYPECKGLFETRQLEGLAR